MMGKTDAAKLSSIILSALICCSLSACGDARELSAIAIVLGAAVDAGEGRLQLTVELSGADSDEADVRSAEGKSMEECLDVLCQKTEEELFWGGTTVVIYGSGVDEATAHRCAMFFYRELRLSGRTPVLRALDCSGADVLSGSYGQSPMVALGLGEYIRSASRRSGETITLIEQLERQGSQADLRQAASVTVNEEGEVLLLAARH